MKKRTIEGIIRKSLRFFPVTVITGARQVGKSTLVKALGDELGFHYVSLDDLILLAEANNDPRFFLTSFPTPLIIDEAQKAPMLFDEIARIVNSVRLEGGNANGMFILTGSESNDLLGRIRESLAGRANPIDMLTLSHDEILEKDDKPLSFNPTDYLSFQSDDSIDSVFARIVRGGYPELAVHSDMKPRDFYAAYLRTYLDRDIGAFIGLENQVKFINFLRYLASLTGQTLDKSKISNALGISSRTVDSWLSVLATSNIVRFVEPYFDSSLTKRIVRTPKFYFQDSGLASYLAGLGDPKSLSGSYFAGAFFETYVVNEIIKGFVNAGADAEVYFYRDNHQNEIDLVVLENGVLHPIEIKMTSSPNKAMVKSFSCLKGSMYTIGTGYLLCLTPYPVKLMDDVFAMPISAI